MNILNVEERKELQAGHYNSPAQFFDAIEAAVIKRLAAGVSVEPSFFNVMDGKTAYIPYYTPKQFTTAIAAARVAALKEGDSPPHRTPGYRAGTELGEK